MFVSTRSRKQHIDAENTGLKRWFQLPRRLTTRVGSSVKSGTLWTISALRPKSSRFYQVRFAGLPHKGASPMVRFFRSFLAFLKALLKYFRIKITYIGRFFHALPFYLFSKGQGFKSYSVSKMIWSRGKLGRPIANVMVLSTAFLVFMFGEVFNSSRFVTSQEISPDYLENVTDIIPQRNSAITAIPESRQRTVPFEYTIESGDTLSTIGAKFKISVDALKYVNNLSNNTVLKVGQIMIIPPVSGLVHKVTRGDTLNSIASKYDVAPQAIADFNYILDTSSLSVGTELVIPDAKIPQPVIIPTQTIIAPSNVLVDTGASKNWCVWPTTVRIITQAYSWYHNGVDIAVPSGQSMPPLFSCSDGQVVRAGWDPFGLGLHVRIDHGNGYETIYGHMSSLDVGYGEKVSKGEVIGLMGSTGRSTGPHVHFIINFKGVAQNPLNYIN